MQELEERGAADPSAHLRRANPDRERASPVRRRDHAGGRARPARAARDRAADRPRPADRGCARGGFGGAVGAVACGRRGARSEARAAPQAAEFRAARARRARSRCWSAPTAASKTAIVSLDGGTSAGGADRSQQFHQCAPVRPDARPRPRRGFAPRSASARKRSTPPRPSWSRPGLAAWSQDHARRPVLIVRGQANLHRRRPPPRISNASAGCSTSSRNAQEIARLLEGARDAPGCRIFIGSENRMFALVGLVGHRRALSREPGRGGRRCRGDRPDAVELCARGPHGGFHSESADEIDGMTDRRKAARRSRGNPQGNRRRTRPKSPSTTASPSSRGSSRRRMRRRSTRRPRRRTCAAGWRARSSRRRAMPRRSFARDMLAIKDHLDRALAAVTDELRARQDREPVPRRDRSDRARARRGVRAPRHHPHRVGRRDARPAPPPGDDRDSDRRAEPGTIVEEMQPGYMMKDRLLRPALVGVAKKPD